MRMGVLIRFKCGSSLASVEAQYNFLVAICRARRGRWGRASVRLLTTGCGEGFVLRRVGCRWTDGGDDRRTLC